MGNNLPCFKKRQTFSVTTSKPPDQGGTETEKTLEPTTQPEKKTDENPPMEITRSSESQNEKTPKDQNPPSQTQTGKKGPIISSPPLPPKSPEKRKLQNGPNPPSEPQTEKKPQTGPSTPSEPQTEKKPQTGPSTPPNSQTNDMSQTGPSTPPDSQTNNMSQIEPSTPPESQTNNMSQIGPSKPPESQPNDMPQTGPSTPPESQTKNKPQTGPSTPSEPQTDNMSQTGPSTPSEPQTEKKPQTGPSTPPESQTNNMSQIGPSTPPESQTNNMSQIGPSTPPESQTNKMSQTGPSTPPEPQTEKKPKTGPSTPPESQTNNMSQIGPSTPPESQTNNMSQTGPSTPSEPQTEKKPKTGPSTPPESQTNNMSQIGPSTPPESQTNNMSQIGPSTPPESQTNNMSQIGPSTPPDSQTNDMSQTGPSTPPESQTNNLPQTGPSTPQESQTNNMPETGPSTPPESQTKNKPQTVPSTPPESQTNNLPQTGPSTPPESQPNNLPETGPSTPPDSQTNNLPQTGPSTPPESQTKNKPQTVPSTPPESQTNNLPQTGPSTPPESQPNNLPETGPSTPPDSQTNNLPQTGPSTPPESQPNNLPQTGPSTPKQKPQIVLNKPSELQTKEEPQMEKSQTEDQGNRGKIAKLETSPRAMIFSSEEDNRMKSLVKWTRNIIPDCQLITPTTIEDWKAKVENCAIVIVYTASSSYEKMAQYMEHWKGYEKVIVVIGDIQTLENEVRSGWDVVRSPQCELHMFTQSELQWVLRDPRLQETWRKIQQIRDIVLRDYQKEMTLKGKQRHQVKFVSMSDIHKNQKKEKNKRDQKRGSVNDNLNRDSTQKEVHWLGPLLTDNEKVDFTSCQISEIKNFLPKEKGTVLTCILHFTKENFQKITEKNSDQQYIKKLKGQKDLTVVVVVDDLNDERLEKDLEEKYKKSEYSGLWHLFLFRREEQRPECLNYVSAEVTAKEKWSKLQISIETIVSKSKTCDTPDTTSCPPPGNSGNREETRTPRDLGIVGIFSRSSNTDYSWIETELKSPDMIPMVSKVRPFYISNNQSGKFYEELGLCSFGILYHTKNRGRVNVTDVTDSLYDEELEAMSVILGRENVIVVIDDLKNSSLDEKQRLLTSQPSIDRYAFDLLLFSEQEKKDGEHVIRLREAIRSLAAGKKTAGPSNSSKNQPEIQGEITGNQDDRNKADEAKS
ncbi:uncharacterized protein [Phyllobates terribilis]|uniref:uncharacterized protein isoform X2 n=1 Tax=Phyllobates terribilis TaxID=111132 RepID=UPI003CCB2ACC